MRRDAHRLRSAPPVVTPRLAARSKRGLMRISGRTRSPMTRGARSSCMVAISSRILLRGRVQQFRVVAAQEQGDVAPAGTAAALALEIDARVGDSPTWLGVSDRSNSVLVFLRSFLRTMLRLPEPTKMRWKTRSTSGSFSTMRRRLGDLGLGLRQRRSRRHADADAGEVEVERRLELHAGGGEQDRRSARRSGNRRRPSRCGGRACAATSRRVPIAIGSADLADDEADELGDTP